MEIKILEPAAHLHANEDPITPAVLSSSLEELLTILINAGTCLAEQADQDGLTKAQERLNDTWRVLDGRLQDMEERLEREEERLMSGEIERVREEEMKEDKDPFGNLDIKKPRRQEESNAVQKLIPDEKPPPSIDQAGTLTSTIASSSLGFVGDSLFSGDGNITGNTSEPFETPTISAKFTLPPPPLPLFSVPASIRKLPGTKIHKLPPPISIPKVDIPPCPSVEMKKEKKRRIQQINQDQCEFPFSSTKTDVDGSPTLLPHEIEVILGLAKKDNDGEERKKAEVHVVKKEDLWRPQEKKDVAEDAKESNTKVTEEVKADPIPLIKPLLTTTYLQVPTSFRPEPLTPPLPITGDETQDLTPKFTPNSVLSRKESRKRQLQLQFTTLVDGIKEGENEEVVGFSKRAKELAHHGSILKKKKQEGESEGENLKKEKKKLRFVWGKEKKTEVIHEGVKKEEANQVHDKVSVEILPPDVYIPPLKSRPLPPAPPAELQLKKSLEAEYEAVGEQVVTIERQDVTVNHRVDDELLRQLRPYLGLAKPKGPYLHTPSPVEIKEGEVIELLRPDVYVPPPRRTKRPETLQPSPPIEVPDEEVFTEHVAPLKLPPLNWLVRDQASEEDKKKEFVLGQKIETETINETTQNDVKPGDVDEKPVEGDVNNLPPPPVVPLVEGRSKQDKNMLVWEKKTAIETVHYEGKEDEEQETKLESIVPLRPDVQVEVSCILDEAPQSQPVMASPKPSLRRGRRAPPPAPPIRSPPIPPPHKSANPEPMTQTKKLIKKSSWEKASEEKIDVRPLHLEPLKPQQRRQLPHPQKPPHHQLPDRAQLNSPVQYRREYNTPTHQPGPQHLPPQQNLPRSRPTGVNGNQFRSNSRDAAILDPETDRERGLKEIPVITKEAQRKLSDMSMASSTMQQTGRRKLLSPRAKGFPKDAGGNENGQRKASASAGNGSLVVSGSEGPRPMHSSPRKKILQVPRQQCVGETPESRNISSRQSENRSIPVRICLSSPSLASYQLKQRLTSSIPRLEQGTRTSVSQAVLQDPRLVQVEPLRINGDRRRIPSSINSSDNAPHPPQHHPTPEHHPRDGAKTPDRERPSLLSKSPRKFRRSQLIPQSTQTSESTPQGPHFTRPHPLPPTFQRPQSMHAELCYASDSSPSPTKAPTPPPSTRMDKEARRARTLTQSTAHIVLAETPDMEAESFEKISGLLSTMQETELWSWRPAQQTPARKEWEAAHQRSIDGDGELGENQKKEKGGELKRGGIVVLKKKKKRLTDTEAGAAGGKE